jgi:adenylosuccinate lyase
MALFNRDEKKVKQLDLQVSKKMGFDKILPVAGQVYTRKLDSQISDVLSGIAQSAHKFSNDLRLLHNLKEIEEPFGKKQIGSSAMPYKRNPMRCERVASLARYIICNGLNTDVRRNGRNAGHRSWRCPGFKCVPESDRETRQRRVAVFSLRKHFDGSR